MGSTFVNFVVCLAPPEGDVPLPQLEEGDIGIEQEFRKPAQCPLGV
jgi:hypothetical protein